MSRLLDEARRLLARLDPAGRTRPPTEAEGAYDTALREAFLSPAGLEPAAARRRSTASTPAAASRGEPDPPPVASAVEPTPAGVSAVARTAMSHGPATRPPRVATAPGRVVSAGHPASAPDRAVAIPAAAAAPELQEELGAPLKPQAPDRPARRRQQAGATAPDHLLAPPTNVDSKADDFFDGLVRRVEGDR